MKKIMIGFVAGFLLASLLFIPIIAFARHDKYEFGHNNGMLDGHMEVLRFLHKHFGVRYPPKGCKDSLITKPGGIYVIDNNGVQTIQTTEH